MWYVLLRIRGDGKLIETWSTYGPPGAGTKQLTLADGFEEQATQFTAWDAETFIVPVRSPKAIVPVYIKLSGNQVLFATANRISGTADCN